MWTGEGVKPHVGVHTENYNYSPLTSSCLLLVQRSWRPFYQNFVFGLELCADVIVSAAARWSILVGGGAPPVQKNRRRRGVGGQKYFFLRFTKKFRSILKIFFGTFLVIKALRFADDQC